MVRASTCVKQYRLCSALASVCLGLAFLMPASVPAQDVPSDPAKTIQDLARKQTPLPAPVRNMGDQPAVSAGRQSGLGADELIRLGLAPIDPALLPKLGDAPSEPDSSVGATVLAVAVFVLGVYVLGRVLR